MNWGARIALLYGGFVVLILSLVFAASKQEFHLVTEDYYREELQHADHMQRVRNTQDLEQNILIAYQGGQEIRLTFPQEMQGVTGTAKLYRPSDSRLDTEFPLSLDGENQQVLVVEELTTGLWKLQIEWDASGKGYYHEQSLVLQ